MKEYNVFYKFLDGGGVITLDLREINLPELTERISRLSRVTVWITKIEEVI